MYRRQGYFLSRASIIEEGWDREVATEHGIDKRVQQGIRRLRRQLEAAYGDDLQIECNDAGGYRLLKP